MNNYQCYAILEIPQYIDYLHLEPIICKEFFDCTKAGFDTNNIEGLCEFFRNVYKINSVTIYWTWLDADHFCELHNL